MKKIIFISFCFIVLIMNIGCSKKDTLTDAEKIGKDFLYKYYSVEEDDYKKYENMKNINNDLTFEEMMEYHYEENEQFKTYITEEKYKSFETNREAIVRIEYAYRKRFFVRINDIKVDKTEKINIKEKEVLRISYTIQYSKEYIENNENEDKELKVTLVLEEIEGEWKVNENSKILQIT